MHTATSHYKSHLLDNFYLLGEASRLFHWVNKSKQMTLPVRTESKDFWQHGGAAIDGDDELRPCAECKIPTATLCVKCDSYAYCDACFQNVHMVACALKLHKLTAIQDRFDIDKCEKHANLEKKLYCRSCEEPICESCGGEHLGHDVSSIAEQVQSYTIHHVLTMGIHFVCFIEPEPLGAGRDQAIEGVGTEG